MCVFFWGVGGRGRGGGGVLKAMICALSFSSFPVGTRTFKEASGITHKFKKPFNISSTLEVHHVHSYLECTILCSSQYLCNAAWFDAPSLTCNLVRADGYTGLENSQNAQTFVREGYIGYTE